MKQTSMRSRLAWAATGLFVACLNLDGRSRAHAGIFSPGIGLGSRFDQRASEVVNGSQWVSSVIPQFTLGRPGPVSNWELSALRSYDSFSTSPTPQAATDLASILASTTPSEHTDLGLQANYVRTADLFYLTAGAPVTSGVTEISGGSAHALSSFEEATYQVQSTNHLAQGLADGIAQDWSAALLPVRSENTSLLVRWWQRDWWVDRSQALAMGVATAGFRRALAEGVTGEVAGGVSQTRDPQHGEDVRGAAWSAGITALGLGVGLPIDARAQVSRDAETTGNAQIWHSATNTWVALRWDRSIDADGGLFHEPTLRDYFAFDVRDTVGGRTIVALGASFARTDTRVGGKLQVENRNATASISRQMQPWLTATISYLYARQVETLAPSAQDSRRSRAELSFTAAVP